MYIILCIIGVSLSKPNNSEKSMAFHVSASASVVDIPQIFHKREHPAHTCESKQQQSKVDSIFRS